MDGHNSHYTIDFLLYARTHNILVLCYPSHTTHVYQGLDVVVFSVLKKFINEERDRWLRTTGTAMDKTNFLTIYGRAHIRALTPANVKAAFKATGVWPFNPAVVTKSMLAPSKVTLGQAHLPVPIIADPATDALVTMFRDLAAIYEEGVDVDVDAPVPIGPEAGPSSGNKQRHDIINKAVHAMSQTPLAHLLTTTSTTHHNAMPATLPQRIPLPPAQPLLTIQPQTETETILLAALRESEAANDALRRRNIGLQCGNILNEVYCGNTRTQLQAQDEKRKKKKVGGTLTGLPVLLSGDEFYEQRQAFEKQKRVEEREKVDRESARVLYRAAKQVWDREEVVRKASKAKAVDAHKTSVAKWEKAKAKAAIAPGGRRGANAFKVPKPKMGPVPKQTPQPKLKDFAEASVESESGSESSSNPSNGENDEDDD